MLIQKYSNTSKRSENHCILGVLGFFYFSSLHNINLDIIIPKSFCKFDMNHGEYFPGGHGVI